MERTVVQQFLYPTFLTSQSNLSFTDQFAFRPTGSRTAAIIFFLSTVTNLLSHLLSYPYYVSHYVGYTAPYGTVLIERMLK